MYSEIIQPLFFKFVAFKKKVFSIWLEKSRRGKLNRPATAPTTAWGPPPPPAGWRPVSGATEVNWRAGGGGLDIDWRAGSGAPEANWRAGSGAPEVSWHASTAQAWFGDIVCVLCQEIQ